jgi:hypothetical protein
MTVMIYAKASWARHKRAPRVMSAAAIRARSQAVALNRKLRKRIKKKKKGGHGALLAEWKQLLQAHDLTPNQQGRFEQLRIMLKSRGLLKTKRVNNP